MRITFLGTAAGEATPEAWCVCASCQAARQHGGRDVRLRSAVLINDDLLIDAGPDLSASAARLGLSLAHVQAMLVTHPHGDHLDPRPFMHRSRRWGGTPLPTLTIYAGRPAFDILHARGIPRSDFADLCIVPYPIVRFEHFSIETGGDLDEDPRLPAGTGAIAPLPQRRYEVWTLAANHFETEGIPHRLEPMLFVIRQTSGPEVVDHSSLPTLFYGTDTEPFLPETWAALERLGAAGVRIGMTVLDGTYGGLEPRHKHMTMVQMIAHQEELAHRSLLTSNALRLTTHLLHLVNPPHEELAAMVAPYGIAPAYDGLAVTVSG